MRQAFWIFTICWSSTSRFPALLWKSGIMNPYECTISYVWLSVWIASCGLSNLFRTTSAVQMDETALSAHLQWIKEWTLNLFNIHEGEHTCTLVNCRQFMSKRHWWNLQDFHVLLQHFGYDVIHSALWLAAGVIKHSLWVNGWPTTSRGIYVHIGAIRRSLRYFICTSSACVNCECSCYWWQAKFTNRLIAE